MAIALLRRGRWGFLSAGIRRAVENLDQVVLELAFKPERFLGQRPGTYTWIPFGGGAHRCLGGAFALFEMRTVLRTILRHRRFEPVTTPDEPATRHHFGVAPAEAGTVMLRSGY